MNAQLRPVHDDRDERTLPAAVESEQSLLGAMLVEPSLISKIRIDPADFFLRQHQELHRLLVAMDGDGKAVDAITVGEHVNALGIADRVGGMVYLTEIASIGWTVGGARSYAETIREKAAMRRVIDIASRLMQEAFVPKGRKPAEIVDGAMGELMTLAKVDSRHDFSLRQAVKLAWEDAQVAYEHRGQIRGVPTGFSRLDGRLGGWHRQDLIFLPARPGIGKTALAVNCALTAAGAKHTVGIVSGEQSALQIGQRSLAIDSGTRAEAMRNGQIDDTMWSLLNSSASRLSQQRIRIFDRSAPTLDEVVRTARAWKLEYGMSILFVDYLQRIRVRGCDKRNEEVAEVAIGLKTLARDLDIPIVCLAQVKAEVEQRTDKRPRQGDIANSDEATREADLIAFLYRDEVYHDDTNDRGIAELNVEKNRHGPCGQFRIAFDAPSMRFHDLAEEPEYQRPRPASPRRAREVPTEEKRGSRKPKSEPRDTAAAAARAEDTTGGSR